MPGDFYTHHSAFVNGIRIHYLREGKGEPVLLWHGFCETSYCWREVIPLLAEKFTVIAPDMRGFGDSDKPPSGYDGENLAKDFRGLMHSLGFRKIFIAAHDMGAPPALIYAGTYPGEVRALAYLEEPLLTRAAMSRIHAFTRESAGKGALWWWKFALAPGMTDRLIVGSEREFITWFYEHNSFDKNSITEETVNEYLRSFSGSEGVNGAFGVYRDIFDTIDQTEKFLSPELRLTMPVLGLGGVSSRGDQVRDLLREVAVTVTGGTLPRCGHFMPDEQPEALAGELMQFFSAHALQ